MSRSLSGNVLKVKLTFSESRKDKKLMDKEAALFKIYDKNHDGKLDRDELRTWIVEEIGNDASMAVSETDHLFKNTDTNKDGNLSKEEIVEQHNLWVGSGATNYGMHLEDEL